MLGLFTPADQAVIARVQAAGLDQFASLHRARIAYVFAVSTQRWAGWQANLVWDMLCAWVKPKEDDIPF
jgi:hypothetical protein